MKTCVLVLLFSYSAVLNGQSDAADYDASVANHYFDFSLKLVKETPGFTPPVAARAFGFMGLTLYEAMVSGMPGYTTTEGIIYELNDVTDAGTGAEYHWPTVANNALAYVIDSLFRTMTPANKDSIIAIKTKYNNLFQGQVSAQVYNDSKAFGEAIATDIFNYSRTDGGHQSFATNFPSDYVPPVGPDLWVPFGSQVCMQPYWGSHRPFIEIDTSINTLSPTPPGFSTEPGSDFYNYADEVYTTGLNLTQEQTRIALYWADGGGTFTPAGHSISILENLLTNTNANLEDAALAYAKLGIAVSDAFLACWKSKYIYNLCRPVTYIRQYIDSTWLPLIATPPFPEYPSGHSSQSGAMASAMTDIFGENYSFIDSAHGSDFGGPRTFESFDEAAQEAAISRLYGGIHFEFGNMAGLTLGTSVGTNVVNLFQQLNVATEDITTLPEIFLYPNPVGDLVSIKSNPEMLGSAFHLIDGYGKIITGGKLADEITTVDVRDLAPGFYILRTEYDLQSYKLVKN